MVKHMVLWRLKDSTNKDEVLAKMHSIFHAFRDEVPGMNSLEVYKSFDGADICLISEHVDRDALNAYQEFPAHIEAKKYVHSVIETREFCDYEY